jgi:CheY-like chemotaxis protein
VDLILRSPDLFLGVAAIAGIAAFVLLRVSRREGPPLDPPAASPDEAKVVPSPATVELMGSWIQFVRDHLREALAGLNNRFNSIGLTAEMLRRGALSKDQQAAVERIFEDIRWASNITAALAHRISSDAPDIPPPAWHILQEAAREPARIVVAEADDNNRIVVARLLRSLGHEVVVAADGREAWEVLARDPVDCVLCDPRMPTLGGRALYEQVEERMPELARRFVFVSGDYTDPGTHAFLEQSGQPVIGKPYELDNLLQAIATVLQEMGRMHRAED